MGWQIKGESGKALNATLRDLDALNIGPWELTLASLADDTFTWTAATEDATGTGTIVPAAGQVIELWLDGVRMFRGHAVVPEVGLTEVTVQARGPWWWMDRIDLSGEIDDGEGTAGDRTSYVFPEQNLKTSLEDLIDRAIDKGVPITRGAVNDCYVVPKMTLSNMSFAAALAELMRWVPDAVAWFDYTDDSALPELNIRRRGNMTPIVLTVGTDNLTAVRVKPRLDQQVTRVELNYVTRHPKTGKPRWAKQTNGTTTTGKLQIITVSGPEIADFLPKDDFEKRNIKTLAAASIPNSYIIANDPALASINKQYGMTGARGVAVSYYTGSPTSKRLITKSFPPLTYQRDNGEYVTNLSGKYLVLTGQPAQWMLDQYGGFAVTIAGTWIAQYFPPNHTMAQTWSAAYEALKAGAQSGGGYHNGDTFGGNEKDYEYFLARPFACRGYLVTTHFPNKTAVYKPWDYDYLSPPADLAENLRLAQNWIAYEGSVQRVSDTVTGYNAVRRTLNVGGGYADYADMNALISSVTYDGRGRTTYTLGSPARNDFASLVGRIRREPQDNIAFI